MTIHIKMLYIYSVSNFTNSRLILVQNGTNKMIAIFGIDHNSREFNTYLVTKSHKSVINTQRKPKGVKVDRD